jgi:hypothetical protein
MKEMCHFQHFYSTLGLILYYKFVFYDKNYLFCLQVKREGLWRLSEGKIGKKIWQLGP